MLKHFLTNGYSFAAHRLLSSVADALKMNVVKLEQMSYVYPISDVLCFLFSTQFQNTLNFNLSIIHYTIKRLY